MVGGAGPRSMHTRAYKYIEGEMVYYSRGLILPVV